MTKPNRENAEAHARLSPSSSARWIACPGSIAAQAEFADEDTSNEHSRRGTAAHALLDLCILLGAQPEDYLGVNLIGENHPEVDQSMCDGVRVALDYLEEQLELAPIGAITVMPEVRVPIGQQINITGDAERDNSLCNGTADYILAYTDRSLCVVTDYKNGAGIVMAHKNPQAMLYAAGARQMLGPFKKYRVAIVQPNAGKRRAVDEWEFTDAALRRFLEKDVRPSARAALLPNAPRSAGEHCKYCRAAPRCRTYRDKARAVARTEFTAVEDAEDPERLSMEEVAEALAAAPTVERYIAKLREYATGMLQRDSRAVPGWELGWGKRQRKWDNEAEVIAFCEQRGMPRRLYAPRGLLSPAELEKAIARHDRQTRGTRQLKRSGDKRQSPIEAFVKYSIPKPQLRPKDRAELDFEPVDDE